MNFISKTKEIRAKEEFLKGFKTYIPVIYIKIQYYQKGRKTVG